jgi:hypothetical protein
MKNTDNPSSLPAGAVRTAELLNRREILQLLGIGAVASGCGALRVRPAPATNNGQVGLQLIAPDKAGAPPAEVLEALLDTGRLLSRFLGLDGSHLNEPVLESYLRLKCEERPSYLATYTRYAAEVKRPEQLSAAWLSQLGELYRVKVVGELAIMALIGGGFRSFGYNNFNGYMGGLWHEPRESGAFRASDEL